MRKHDETRACSQSCGRHRQPTLGEALQELERAFSARISELESNLSEEGAVTAELAENVATANAEVETAMASQQQVRA